MFDHLIVSSETSPSRSPRVLAVSLLLHGTALALLLAAPLFFYSELPGSELLADLILLAPPSVPAPPVPPPVPAPRPEPAGRPATEPKVIRLPEMMEPPPSAIPEAPDADVQLDDVPYLTAASPGLLAGPVAGGRVAAPAGWLESRVPDPPPPPATPRKEPQRVSSGVQSARLVRRVEPVYPPLALAARISGPVVLQLWIDEEGNVVSVKVLDGPPLLKEAARTAVLQWKYSPTILNGEPWPVLANVTIRFVLH